jgi:hypothetical protein
MWPSPPGLRLQLRRAFRSTKASDWDGIPWSWTVVVEALIIRSNAARGLNVA